MPMMNLAIAHCPVCRRRMEPKETREGRVVSWVCPKCHGVWEIFPRSDRDSSKDPKGGPSLGPHTRGDPQK